MCQGDFFDGINRSYGDILNHEDREGHEVLIADLTTDYTVFTDFSDSGGLAGLAFFWLDLLQSEL